MDVERFRVAALVADAGAGELLRLGTCPVRRHAASLRGKRVRFG
jgi:hypothetical protein